jgi:hypothetical protein
MRDLLHPNFHEKAHSVKADVAAPVWLSASAVALRAMFLSAVNTLEVVAGDASDRPDPSIRRTAEMT